MHSIQRMCCTEVLEVLLEAGADPCVGTSQGLTPLMIAAQIDSSALLQLLLDYGADIGVTDNEGQNALYKAASHGNVSMMETLVNLGLSIHTVESSTGYTLLMIAAAGRHMQAAEWLLQQGVPVNAANLDGCTALHAIFGSSSCGGAAMIELLLANGADVNQRTKCHQTPLDIAAHVGNVQCAKVLIAAGVDVNNAGHRGLASLHVACISEHASMVKLLFEHGAAAVISSVISIGCFTVTNCCPSTTALMMCTAADTVKLLLAAGADVHITNSAGDTCLHVAAKHNWKAPMLCLLIKAGADLHVVNNEGKTAAELAQDRGHALIEQLLVRAAQQGH
jgi:uncharacterized protein